MFRIGLLFTTALPDLGAVARVTRVLDKIADRSAALRGQALLTVVPFVRTPEMAMFTRLAVGNHAVHAATFDDGGINFVDLGSLLQAVHLPVDDDLDFGLGLRVVTSRCDIVIVVCADAAGLAAARERVAMFANCAALFALVRIDDNVDEFSRVDPEYTPLDEPSWLLELVERWRAASVPPPTAPRTRLGLLFPYVSSLLIGRRTETVKKRDPGNIERCRSGMGFSVIDGRRLHTSDFQALAAITDGLCPAFDGHDELGRYYANVFRTTCLIVPFLIVLSTVLAAAAALDEPRHQTWHVTEGVLLLLASLLYIRSSRGRFHRQWIEHRLVTELIRPTPLHALFDTGPLLTPPTENPALWIERSRMALRYARTLPLTRFVTSNDELLSARISAIASFAAYQAGWHRDFAEQHHTAEARMAGWSAKAFLVTLALCVGQLVVAYLETTLSPGIPGGLHVDKGVLHAMTLLTLAAAMSALLVLLLAHQLGFAAIAERSANAAEQFARLANAIRTGAHRADARQAYEWHERCSRTILLEQLSWYRQMPLIKFHL
jgi:hypothetical protein